MEGERKPDHDPRVTVADQTFRQLLDDQDFNHRNILQDLQLFPKDLEAERIATVSIQKKLGD